MADEKKLLHVFGQRAHHDEAFVVGNRAALVALRAAIDAALDEGNKFKGATASAMVSDGEGFDVHVMLGDDAEWPSEFWTRLATPYSAEWITDNSAPETIWPGAVMAERLKETKK